MQAKLLKHLSMLRLCAAQIQLSRNYSNNIFVQAYKLTFIADNIADFKENYIIKFSVSRQAANLIKLNFIVESNFPLRLLLTPQSVDSFFSRMDVIKKSISATTYEWMKKTNSKAFLIAATR
jgi:hypothetical protein